MHRLSPSLCQWGPDSRRMTELASAKEFKCGVPFAIPGQVASSSMTGEEKETKRGHLRFLLRNPFLLASESESAASLQVTISSPPCTMAEKGNPQDVENAVEVRSASNSICFWTWHYLLRLFMRSNENSTPSPTLSMPPEKHGRRL